MGGWGLVGCKSHKAELASMPHALRLFANVQAMRFGGDDITCMMRAAASIPQLANRAPVRTPHWQKR